MATSPIIPDSEPNQRRMLMRRGRSPSGFSARGAGASTRSESLRAPAEEVDEVDEAIEPSNLNQHARTLAASPVYNAAPMPPDGDDQQGGSPEDINPRGRLNQVAMAGSSAYAKEYRLRLLARLLMRNVPLDQIATQLGVSISTVEKDRAALHARMREQAKHLDINEIIGESEEFYSEVAGMAMRLASASTTPIPMKLASLRTALASKADRTRMLTSTGVLDVLRFRRNEEGDDLSDVQQLMRRTDELLENLMAEEEEGNRPPPPPPRRVVRPARPGSFTALSFDDKSASNSSDEVVEL